MRNEGQRIANKQHKPEEIGQKLRQVAVLVGQGMVRVDATREVRITEQSYYRWRKQHGGYSYRRVAVPLREAGWQVSNGRIERLWRREGLKVPPKQPKRGRLWLKGGSCIRLRPKHRNQVWSYDFVHCRIDDGKAFRRECLAILVKRKLNSTDFLDVLTHVFILRGPPAFVRSDNGPEFVAKDVRVWIEAVGAKTAFIEPG